PLADADRLGISGRAGGEDDAAEVVGVAIAETFALNRAALAFRPRHVGDDESLDLGERLLAVGYQGIDLEASSTPARRHRYGGVPQAGQGQHDRNVEDDVLDADGHDTAGRELERERGSANIVDE